eukprot:scaffold1947_cov207-Prasinococcus_capsulatus_cf.AAC.7
MVLRAWNSFRAEIPQDAKSGTSALSKKKGSSLLSCTCRRSPGPLDPPSACSRMHKDIQLADSMPTSHRMLCVRPPLFVCRPTDCASFCR